MSVYCVVKMNSPLVTLGSIFVISAILSQVSGELPRISTCGLGGTIPIRKGDPCFIHCSVTDLQEDEEIAIVKVGVRYYGWNLLPISKSMEIEYYNKSTGLNPGLPDRYTAHPGVNQVNITLSVALPEDMGFFECWLRKGTDVTKGGLSAISVEGGVIEQYWERLDESGNQVERFEKDEKITIEYDDITQLAFRAKIVEPLNQNHLITLLSNDLQITDAFERANLETIEGEISEVGLIKGFTSSAHYHSPSLTAIPLTSTVEFKNRIILGIPLHPESGYEEISLNLAVQAVPSTVTGDFPQISKCGSFSIPVTRENPCYIHCAVMDWQDADVIGIRKIGVTYYGLDSQPITESMDIEYYNSNTGLNLDLPDKYNVEQRSNEVNISISAALPEDIGDFECWTTKGNEVNTSEPITLEVRPAINQYWERWDESGSVVQRFENDEEITIEYADIASLAFRVDLSEPGSRGLVINLRAKSGAAFNSDIKPAFKPADVNTERGDVSDIGLIGGFSSTASFSSPDVGDPLISSIPLSSTVIFQGITVLGTGLFIDVNLHLNVQAVPQVQAGRCDKSFEAGNGGTIVFKCEYASNPGQPSFALQLPGRNGRIESGHDDKFDFEVTKSDNADTPYLYNLQLTYRNIKNEVFGTNKLYARNEMGESPSAYEFTISAGSKPGLLLLVPVISSLIAIASFASRF